MEVDASGVCMLLLKQSPTWDIYETGLPKVARAIFDMLSALIHQGVAFHAVATGGSGILIVVLLLCIPLSFYMGGSGYICL